MATYIQWTGNPYDATIGIQAVYTAQNVQFSDLGISAASGLRIINSLNVLHYRGDILVTATLKNKLVSPDISFKIDLPDNSPLKNDQDALSLIQKIESDPNELNKQVSCLVVLNSFVPLSNSTTDFQSDTRQAPTSSSTASPESSPMPFVNKSRPSCNASLKTTAFSSTSIPPSITAHYSSPTILTI